MNWASMSLREFQAALASSSPTPGGGTAAAVALGQAAALSIMVCDLTLGKEKWAEGWAIAEEIQSLAIPMMERANQLATEDSEAFDRVMAGFSMPKSTEEEKGVRRTHIRAATYTAAEVPFETASLALDLLTKLPALARSGNANAVTDVGVAGLLASAAAKGALFNVDINLDSLPEEMAAELRAKSTTVSEQTRIESRAVMEAVRARMSQ
ncbi:MAG: cyclodeaminase/cyclohydrolase family protein [Candidatus Poseidoniales archaeon]